MAPIKVFLLPVLSFSNVTSCRLMNLSTCTCSGCKKCLKCFFFEDFCFIHFLLFYEESNCVIVHVPINITDQFQPLDLNANGHTKEFLKGKFECWFTQQITNQLKGGSSVYDVQVPLKLSPIN